MSPLRAALLAVLTAIVVVVAAMAGLRVPLGWAVLIGLPAGCAVLVAALFSGAFDAHWAPEPDPPTGPGCSHAALLADRLSQAGTDPHRFVTRVRPRLRRLAIATLHREPGTEGVTDLRDPRARAALGTDLHRLLTAPDARLPSAATLAALVRRLEER